MIDHAEAAMTIHPFQTPGGQSIPKEEGISEMLDDLQT